MISITVEGAGAIANAKGIMTELVVNGITNMCYAMEAEAKERCPVQTGELRRSIMTEIKADTDQIEGKVGTTLDYAPYIHEGTGIYSRTGAGRKDVPWVYYSPKDGKFHSTSGVKSRPFLEEAANAIAPRITEFFGEV